MLVCFSKSGTTEELLRLVPYARVGCCLGDGRWRVVACGCLAGACVCRDEPPW